MTYIKKGNRDESLDQTQRVGMDSHKIENHTYNTRDKALKTKVSEGFREWSLIYHLKSISTTSNSWKQMSLPIAVFIGIVIAIELVAVWSHL